jgi:DNA (cytosine-5)-methyltransferase 1
MLQLDRGNAMRFLVDSLEAIGFSWAYRIVDSRAFGLPQRRQRVIMLASRTRDPRTVLFADDMTQPADLPDTGNLACGFYWTEGTRGLGWAVDAIPTLKGGSGLGIPSPPAIRLPNGRGIVTPDIRDAERLQGFPPDWTAPGVDSTRRSEGARWKMVGNAVSVPVAEWLGCRLRQPAEAVESAHVDLPDSGWPTAAAGIEGRRYQIKVSRWPVRLPREHLDTFLQFEPRPLSQRATAGFLSRAEASRLRFPQGFLHAVRAHLERVRLAA